MTADRRKHPRIDVSDPEFSKFWAAYPRKVARLEALKAWAQISPDAETVNLMVATLEWQRAEWATKPDATWIPHPASWLRAERWNDERPQVTVNQFSLRERDEAAQIRKAWGRCRHDPICESYTGCVVTIAQRRQVTT